MEVLECNIDTRSEISKDFSSKKEKNIRRQVSSKENFLFFGIVDLRTSKDSSWISIQGIIVKKKKD